MLLGGCQGFVGHVKLNFDTYSYLSGIYLYVTNVLIHYFAFYPIMPFAVRAQSVQDRKQWLVIRAGFYLQHELGSHVDSWFPNDHHANK